MTTLTTATAPAPAARPHLTRWLLRLHRPALYVWSGLVLALAALLLVLHGPLTDAAADAWRQYDACTPAHLCRYDQNAILRYKDWYNYATLAAAAVPLLAAGWAGGALGKELESGTARLAWTQSSTPVRWLAVRLAIPAAAVAAGTGLLVWLHHLAWAAGHGRIDTTKEWYDVWTFHTNGPTLVALALCGLTAGALTGLLSRRTLPGLGLGLLLTGAIWAAVQLLMPRLWPWRTRSGQALFDLPHSTWTWRSGTLTGDVPYGDYHPASHYWPLQLTTGVLLLAVAALLTLGCFLALRRLTGRTTAR
ncbi:ABC transporter permease [Streptomyces sp. NPDC051014]|uniref:ABC transporter permease n=1 Tax=Streptomyces sp. NPDC051014 TaxID=3155751 RepID=UPI0033D91783